MSFEEIECTLRTLGLNNKSSSLIDRNPLSRQKMDKYFAEHQHRVATVEESAEVSGSQGNSQSSRESSRNSKQSSKSRTSSNMSRYKDSDGSKNKKHIPCPNCHKKGNEENASDYGNAPSDRIKFLERRIRLLEKEIQSKGKGGSNLPQDQYFMSFKPEDQPRTQRKDKQQTQFVNMCIDMVSKLTKVEQPSLKYCWKFMKVNISNALKGESLTVDFPKSPVKRKIQFILHQTRDVLGVKRNQSIPQTVRKLKEENLVLSKVYEKILKLFQLKVTHPHMLAYYLEDYTEKINRFEAEADDQ